MFLSHSSPQRDKGLMALDYERIRNVAGLEKDAILDENEQRGDGKGW